MKPVIKDLDVLGPEDKNESLFHKVWEGIVGGAGKILENKKEDQIATRLPIEGKFDNPNIEVITAIVEVLRNAFINALAASLDYDVNINTVDEDIKEEDRGLFQRIFNNDEKDKDDKKENK